MRRRVCICSAVIPWSEMCRILNNTLLSHFILPQPGRPGPRICIPQEQGSPVMPQALVSLFVASYASQ
jgi:hypothetical protein